MCEDTRSPDGGAVVEGWKSLGSGSLGVGFEGYSLMPLCHSFGFLMYQGAKSHIHILPTHTGAPATMPYPLLRWTTLP